MNQPASELASVTRALELHAQGRAENARGRHSAASEILNEALQELERSPDDDRARIGRVRVLVTLAWAQAELHGLDHGLGLLHDAYRAVDSGALSESDAHSLRTPLHNQHGLLLLRAGQPAEARAQFTEAERWFAHAPVLEQCNVLLNRGALGINTLDVRGARSDLARCAELAGSNGLPLLMFKAMHNLGYLEFLAGDLPRALSVMDDASSIEVDHQRGVDLIDRARVLMEAGLIRDADDVLRDAISLLQNDDSSTHDFAEAMLERARCRLQTLNWSAGLADAKSAEQIFAQRGNVRRARAAALTQLVAQVGLGHPDEGMIAEARMLAGVFSGEGQDGDARSANMLAARLMLKSGRTDEARQLVDVVGAKKSSDRIAITVVRRHVRAELAFAIGDTARGRREVRTGLAELTSYRARFGSIDAQSASAVHGVLLSELDISAAINLARPESIFDAVERSRSLSGGIAAVKPPDDDATVELLAELRRVTVRMQNDTFEPDDAAALERRRLELQRAIKATEWRHAGARAEPRAATIGEVRTALTDSGANMVMFFAAAEHTQAMRVDAPTRQLMPAARSDELRELCLRVRADLDVLADRLLPSVMAAAVRSSLYRSLTTLDDWLIRPLRLDGRPLVIVPTGRLTLVPWGMLPSLKGVPITVAPSASSWLRGHVTARPVTGASRVVALAGPGLTRATEEAHHVASAWANGRSQVEQAATGAALRAALGEADIVHVAAHGRHDPDNPLFSSITMADGQVFGYDVVGDIRPGVHVVLSACELGLTAVRPGDVPLGLTHALLHYGATSVVSGVARLADDIAADVMMRYHELLADGVAPAEALAAATTADDIAPFVCFGAALG